MKYYYIFTVLIIIIMSNYGVIPPWINSGIYCDDISITFKYQGDTVPTVYLFLGMFLPPFLVVRKKIIIYIIIKVSAVSDLLLDSNSLFFRGS